MAALTRGFFERHPVVCARDLIGKRFLWKGVGGIVVETEAYAASDDEACHTFSRPSTRRFVAAHPAGTSYVYLNYGMYWLINVLVKCESMNGFVLLRALEPTHGLDRMRQRRKRERLTDLCSGPGKMSVALGMDGSHHGIPLGRQFEETRETAAAEAVESTRIGISRATDRLWRFTARDNPHVSVKAPVALGPNLNRRRAV